MKIVSQEKLCVQVLSSSCLSVFIISNVTCIYVKTLPFTCTVPQSRIWINLLKAISQARGLIP